MICYPDDWKEIGVKKTLDEIESIIVSTLKDLNCSNLSLSGGVDSSLLLYYLHNLFGKEISCFAIAFREDHPDIYYSALVAKTFNIKLEVFVSVVEDKESDFPGDGLIRDFYKRLPVSEIIAGDGVDEFNGGYYDHMEKGESAYFDYIHRLVSEHLIPLNENSGDVRVFLPYLNPKLIDAFQNIPLTEKFGLDFRKKIIYDLAKGKVPDEIINRRKYGFCDAGRIK